jgi:crotonobetaine/carnitine-CoA ligase
VTASELAQFLETRLARFKTPRYWAFVEEMPMTASERVAKPRLSRDVENGVVDLSGL